MEAQTSTSKAGGATRPLPLLFSVFAVATCAIVYELMIASISSYLLGDSIYQFSVTVGLFLTTMGVGSYLSRRVHRNLLLTFIAVELVIGAVGGSSTLLLYYVYGNAKDVYQPAMYLVIAVIGTLAGLEIPIVTRLLSEKFELRINIANVLSFDYLGGLLGSLAFPLLLLPFLGLLRTALAVGLVNAGVAALVLMAYWQQLPERRYVAVLVATVVGLLATAMWDSANLWDQLEQRLYRDPVVFSEQTPYQHITITQWRDDLRLFLDGNLQFSSLDEYRYHEPLIHPAMAAARDRSEVLILGGGDGLAVREALKYTEVKRVTLVDLDPQMVSLFRTQPQLTKLNGDSLNDPRVRVVEGDAFKFLEDDNGFYGVIIADLPDPRNENIQKLYTVEFYRLASRRLAVGGAFVTQATSPYFAPEAYWCIYRSMKEVWPQVAPYHAQVPSFGDWGFLLATSRPVDPSTLAPKVPTRFLDGPTAATLFVFPADMPQLQMAPNSLIQPVLPGYYRQGWRQAR
ncbi:MAG TPA: polyamine aminopropyltransferase [Chloroflexota bacterium]|nr:polyamine aminopropyltransferase [Chloroflexota bacterium]